MSFRNYIKSHGFSLIDIIGDGNCLFRAFSYILHGTEDRHGEIRTRIVEHMESHEPELSNFQETELPWPRYIANMRKEGTFGGYLEIFVFALIYETRVGVLQLGMPMHYISGGGDSAQEIPTVYLAYHDFQHYSVLLPDKK